MTRHQEKYYPSKDELSLLTNNIKVYFSLPKRSNERKSIVDRVFDELKNFNPAHWTTGKVRLWFNNNKEAYGITEDGDNDHVNEVTGLNLLNSQNELYPVISENLLSNKKNYPVPLIIPVEASPPDLFLPMGLPVEIPDFTEKRNDIQVDDSFSHHFDQELVKKEIEVIEYNEPTEQYATFTPESSSQEESPEEESDKSSDNQIHIPTIPDGWNPETLEMDSMKFKFYECLKSVYSAAHKCQYLSPPERLEQQIYLEVTMKKIIEIMKTKIKIPTVVSSDPNIKQTPSRSANRIKRGVSTTTGIYTGMTPQSKAIMTGNPNNVKYPKDLKFPSNLNPDLKNFFYGTNVKVDFDEISNVETAVIYNGNTVYTQYDGTKQATYLCYNNMPPKQLGFFALTVAILVDDSNSIIWVGGDGRLIGYAMDDLRSVYTFFISKEPLAIIPVHVIGTTVYVANQNEILSCDLTKYNEMPNGPTLKNKKNEENAKNAGYKLESIDWTPGKRMEAFYNSSMPSVSMITSLDGMLIYASVDYHSIHILKGQELQAILVGHTDGILNVSINDKHIITSSKDYTIRVWNSSTFISEHQIHDFIDLTKKFITRTIMDHEILFFCIDDKLNLNSISDNLLLCSIPIQKGHHIWMDYNYQNACLSILTLELPEVNKILKPKPAKLNIQRVSFLEQ